jgi:DNA-directed RNA polymerase subunit M/transcription elongation factor TFIIS
MNNVNEHESYNIVEESDVEFCDKCGALMLPKKKDGKPILKCRECGHEKSVKSPPEYKVEYRIKHSPREKIVVVEEDDQRQDEMSEDERRERRKAILEHFEPED